MVVEKESRHQQQTMQAVLAEVAELESTKTISGDYELKLQRQNYFLTKQMTVCVCVCVCLMSWKMWVVLILCVVSYVLILFFTKQIIVN